MTDTLRIALAQLNPRVGDIPGNLAKARAARGRGAELGADLVVLSELFITGYPPEDLILKPSFQAAAEAAVTELARETADGGPALMLGTPWRENGALYNAVALLDGGDVVAQRYKHDLPNYGVFDEKRLFRAGPLPGPVNFRGVRLGVMVCEDMWTPEVAECLQETGAEILVVGNGSPFEADKLDERMTLAVGRVVDTGLPLIYVNQFGGQDELVFDGGSFVLSHDRALTVQSPFWCEDIRLTNWQRNGEGWQCDPQPPAAPRDRLDAIYQAMVVGLRDYVDKNGFPGIVLGLSGGIDSALTAVVAVDALGADRVRCLIMPSPYTSQSSIDDAEDCAAALGVRTDTVSIKSAMDAYSSMLNELFAAVDTDVTEENIQARIRGMTIMAFSNKFGHMALTTGNKSEMSVGYATLYGDMCGGYSVLKDVYKTMVYDLSSWRNANLPDAVLGPGQRVIPENIITKAPSAELKPDQTDQDTLPPYDKLDDILECLVEHEMASADIVARGHEAETVARITRMLYIAEYKRRQAPPGVKITRRSFGRDRRYPITNAFIGAK